MAAQVATARRTAWLPLDLSAIQVQGPLERRIQLALNHVLAERGRILGGEGFGQAWGTDQYGRWIGAVALAMAYNGQSTTALTETVHGLLALQGLNGFFSRAVNSLTWWGAGRGLIGLLEYWGVTRDPAALAAATRLGEFYLAHFPLVGDGFGTHHGGHTEGLVALWQATRQAEFLELARQIPATESADFGKPGDPAAGQHTHSFLSAARGCVDLFLSTGKTDFLQRAQAIWDHVRRYQMWVTGGISEGSHYAFETRDETCAVADWLRLSLKLWQATGDRQYMDVAEHVLLNHLGFDQDHSGGFCTYRSIGENPAGQVRDVVAWFCCSMHGLRALLEAARFIYAQAGDRLTVNLFVASQAHFSLARGRVSLAQSVESPLSPVHLAVQPEGPLDFELQIRIPAWTTSAILMLNGQPVAEQRAHDIVAIRRIWYPGDVVEMTWGARLQVVSAGSNSLATPASAAAGKVEQAALVYGPLVLMLDPTLNIYDLFEWGSAELVVPLKPTGEPFLVPLAGPIFGRGTLTMSAAGFMTLARPRNDPADPLADDGAWRLAVMVPIAELTDRWSFSLARAVPYEVRNDVWLLAPGNVEAYQARLMAQFNQFVQRRRADTTLGDG